MTPEERELRRALDYRSGEVTPEFRARLSSALSAEGRPSSNFMPALAAVAAVMLVFATVGVLLLARQARNQPPPIAATTPTATPTTTPSPDSSPSPEPTPTPVADVVPGVLVELAGIGDGRTRHQLLQLGERDRTAGERAAKRAFVFGGLGVDGRPVPLSLGRSWCDVASEAIAAQLHIRFPKASDLVRERP